MVEEELLRQAMREAGLISATPTPEEEASGLNVLAKKKFTLPMAPGEQAVRDFYDKNQSEFDMPKNVRLSQIHFQVPPSATAEERAAVRARAEKALERIQAGEPFAQVADELTENPRGRGRGGDVGLVWMDDEWLVKALEGVQVGEYTGVVEAPHKFDILLLTEVNEAQITPFDEVKQSISRHLRLTEQDQLRQAYLRSLREQFPVVLVLEKLKEEFPNGLFE
jgi:parvulin-like peptidyl-prolyl isomerase